MKRGVSSFPVIHSRVDYSHNLTLIDHSIINRVHPESVPISGNGVAQNYPHPQRAYLLPTRLQAGHDIEEDEPARAVQSP